MALSVGGDKSVPLSEDMGLVLSESTGLPLIVGVVFLDGDAGLGNGELSVLCVTATVVVDTS